MVATIIGVALIALAVFISSAAGAGTRGSAATSITVSVQPADILANGSSQTLATATVKDGSGIPVAGEAVTISSNDQNEVVTTTTGNGDGTYSAMITSSTMPATVTITATDATAGISNTTPLIQAGPATGVSLQLSPSTVTANGTDTSTATATVTDANGNGVPGETVAFSSTGGNSISTTTDNADGTYTATVTSTTTAGTPSIKAMDGALTDSKTLTQVPGPATNVSVQLSPAAIPADGVATSTATATVTDQFGNPVAGDSLTLSSSDPHSTPPQDNGDGTYTAMITSTTTAGTPAVTFTDTSVSGVFGTATLTQSSSTTTPVTVTSADCAPCVLVYANERVALVASVASQPGSVPPSGSLTFKNGSTSIAGCTRQITPAAPQATCQTAFAASTAFYHLTAVFTPTSAVAASTSSPADLGVLTDPTTIALDVSNPAVPLGGKATYTATVSPRDSGPLPPSGTIQFLDGGQPIQGCGAQPLATGAAFSATCTVTYTHGGTHTITAVYSGDQNFRGATTQSPVKVTVSNVPQGTIRLLTAWTFRYTPSYTSVLGLRIFGAPVGATVQVKCHGSGCPYTKHSFAVQKRRICTGKGKSKHCGTPGKHEVNLTPSLQNHRLAVGTRLIVEIVRPGWIGKYYRFTMAASRAPKTQISCLAPGHSKPGTGC